MGKISIRIILKFTKKQKVICEIFAKETHMLSTKRIIQKKKLLLEIQYNIISFLHRAGWKWPLDSIFRLSFGLSLILSGGKERRIKTDLPTGTNRYVDHVFAVAFSTNPNGTISVRIHDDGDYARVTASFGKRWLYGHSMFDDSVARPVSREARIFPTSPVMPRQYCNDYIGRRPCESTYESFLKTKKNAFVTRKTT